MNSMPAHPRTFFTASIVLMLPVGMPFAVFNRINIETLILAFAGRSLEVQSPMHVQP